MLKLTFEMIMSAGTIAFGNEVAPMGCTRIYEPDAEGNHFKRSIRKRIVAVSSGLIPRLGTVRQRSGSHRAGELHSALISDFGSESPGLSNQRHEHVGCLPHGRVLTDFRRLK